VATFALVHGAWHDAWCWGALTPELEAQGHEVVAMDLPCDDPAATFDTYADTVVEAVAHCGDDLVVVGHSLAGHTIPLVAAKRPVRRLVFLCALLAMPGRSLLDQLRGDAEMLLPGYEKGLAVDGGLTWWTDEQLARQRLYADCADDVVAAAIAHLRPQAMAPYTDAFALDAVPHVERAYVVCAEDRLVNPDWSRAEAPARLGVEPIELPGSHSPFLSRPSDLARLLHALA
jgi:hypothetical protein